MDNFDSPQQEALKIALTIRTKLLEGKEDIISVLRNCLVVALNLSKEEDLKWIKGELLGKFSEIPSYRVISCPDWNTDKLGECKVPFEIKLLYDFVSNKGDIRYEGKNRRIRPIDSARIIDSVTNKCLFFLNKCISELQYGGYMQSIFEEIRKNVESKISNIDIKILQELNSIYTNLRSDNPSDWIKVAHSCRRIWRFLADKIFPPSDEIYKTKDNRSWIVKDNNVLNRIICFFDRENLSDIAPFEYNFVEGYLRKINKEIQDDEHKFKVSKSEVSIIALHTYLILSNILEFYLKNK